MKHSLDGNRRGAFTLLEVMITVVLLGLVLGSMALVGSASDRAFQTSSVRTHLEAQAAQTMERMVTDLRIAAGESLAPALGDGDVTSWVEYRQAVGLDGNKTVLSGTRRLAFEYEAGELDDGIDNNGNGLIDEGRIVLIENLGTAEERRLVLTRWVREHLAGEEPNGLDDNGNGLIDEPGFFLRRSGDTLTLELTLERLDREGRPILRTSRSSTKLRN